MTKPSPMPAVAQSLIPMKDAAGALARGLDAWNASQLRDAIRSAEFFIDQAKQAIDQNNAPAASPSEQERGAV